MSDLLQTWCMRRPVKRWSGIVAVVAPASDLGCFTGKAGLWFGTAFSTQSSRSGAQRAQRRGYCDLRSRRGCIDFVTCFIHEEWLTTGAKYDALMYIHIADMEAFAPTRAVAPPLKLASFAASRWQVGT